MEYHLYIDEQDEGPDNPYFCLGGLIVSRKIYENNMIPQINNFKIDNCGRMDTIFHYTDMKNNRNGFEFLQDGELRNEFWRKFNNEVSGMDFNTLAIYINKAKYKECFGIDVNKCYELVFRRAINSYIMFLKSKSTKKNQCVGDIIFESRSWNENRGIQTLFYKIMEEGTDIYSAEDCKKYISTIGFITKKDNCVGLQLADFVPNSFIRNICGMKNFHNVGNTFINKVVTGPNGGNKDTCGFVEI